MLVCYFLGNGFKFDAKIDKNTCIKQIKTYFFFDLTLNLRKNVSEHEKGLFSCLGIYMPNFPKNLYFL